mmetsp:Transcript_17563/g.15836  ORF Transcript_17563/g.15836 Transcript_17563/m.15836 type:complete len:495 (+) Transcript_17563:13-1497(+)
MSGLLLFVISTVMSLSRSKYIKRNHILSIHSAYLETLSLLFGDLSKKNPSRHTIIPGKEKTTNEIFEERKSFFQNKFNSLNGCLKNAKIIHIAGTKGKGSTVEYIASSIRKAGKRVGVFTSPHIHTARERLKIGKELISKEKVIRLGNKALDEMESLSWTVFFDLLVHMAMNYFSEESVEYIVLETGIGGRYDSTNFIDNPVAVVLTSISLDHQAILGDTLEEIAWQKAGIIKANSHVFTSENQPKSVLDIFSKQCNELNATLHIIKSSRELTSSLHLSTPYDVQVQNACVAAAAINHLDIPTNGMTDFYWPCRMETFRINETTVVLDGCHNGDSVNAFLQSLKEIYKNHEIIVLFGAGMEKCVDDMLKAVLHYPDQVVMIQSKHFRSVSEEDLINKCKLLPIVNNVIVRGIDSRTDIDFPKPKQKTNDGTISERLKWILEYTREKNKSGNSKKCIVSVCGSLFAAAEAREELYKINPNLFSEDDWVRQSDSFV